MKTFLWVFLFGFSVYAEANGSMTKTCSGRMRYCDKYGICSMEHYYLYAYQYIQINTDGSLRTHRYRFKMRDILGNKQDYIARDYVEGNHLVFDGPIFSIAIPWDSTLPFYYFQPNYGVHEWQELCP